MAPKRPLRRPAAAKARHRPAAAGVPVADPGGDGERRGPVKLFRDVPAVEWGNIGYVVAKDAVYYSRKVDLCGRPLGIRVDGGQTYVEMKVSGTKDEELVRVLSGKRDRMVSIHICPHNCAKTLTDSSLVHGEEYYEVRKDDEPWQTNVEEVLDIAAEEDELAEMRKAAEAAAEAKGGGESPKGEKAKSSKEKKKNKKKRKEKEDPKKGAGEGSQKKAKKDESGDSEASLERGQKTLSSVFSGTGLDPKRKERKKLFRRAKQLQKKKKKKESSSASSGSGSSDESEEGSDAFIEKDLFDEEKSLKRLWRQCPGVLAASVVTETKDQLVTMAGTSWAADRSSLPRVMTQYFRTTLSAVMSAPMQQESLTLAQAMDLCLQGKIAMAMDLLGQRLKSLESMARGSHWAVARQLELVKADSQGLTGETENLAAARKAREESKLRNMLQQPSGNRGDWQGGQKGRKGKDAKGGGKHADTRDLGKGGDNRKDDGKEHKGGQRK